MRQVRTVGGAAPAGFALDSHRVRSVVPMRILLLTHRPPFPPDKGDKIRSFHMLRHLAGRHEVHLATLVDDAADLAHLPELATRVRSVAHARIDAPLRRPFAALSLLGGRSASVAFFHCAALQRDIDRLIDTVDFDVVLAYSSPMAEYVLRSRHAAGRLVRARKLVDYIDVDSAKWSDYAARGGWRAIAWRAEARALAAHERCVARRFDQLFLTSAQEADAFPDPIQRPRIVALPNGVDLSFFAPTPGPGAGDRPRLVFTGVMDYLPNVEGVAWFAAQVWPSIRAAHPEAQFDIVGSRPSPLVRELGREPGINVTGRVEDVRRYLAAAHVSVAPLQIARGVQNKVLEAMAMARPVVATSAAACGVAARHGHELLVADDPGAFAAAVLELLRDRQLAASIGQGARACVERHHCWDRSFAILDGLLS